MLIPLTYLNCFCHSLVVGHGNVNYSIVLNFAKVFRVSSNKILLWHKSISVSCQETLTVSNKLYHKQHHNYPFFFISIIIITNNKKVVKLILDIMPQIYDTEIIVTPNMTKNILSTMLHMSFQKITIDKLMLAHPKKTNTNDDICWARFVLKPLVIPERRTKPGKINIKDQKIP